MKNFKILATVIMAATLGIVEFLWFNIFRTETISSLAMEQIKNPSVATDTALRNFNAAPTVFMYCWIALGIVVLIMFLKDIKNFYKDFTDGKV